MKKVKILLYVCALFYITHSYTQESNSINWWNPQSNEFHVIAGQAWPNEVNSLYHRLPARAQDSVRTPLWNLSKQSAGLSIRFKSNANSILVKYKVKGRVSLRHMPSTGVSGLDLYSKTRDDEWIRCWGSYKIDSTSTFHFKIDENSKNYKEKGRIYQLFLPLYNEVETLKIGTPKDAFLEALPIREERPIVAYGTSICQGACASRPGMAWTNILERTLDLPFINLGFSGNGRLEPELISLMTEIDAIMYILDCLPNLKPERDDTYQLVINAVKQLRSKRPDVPIILTAHIGYANDSTNKTSANKVDTLNKALNRAFEALKEEGYSQIFIIQKEALGLNYDSLVDHIHPNDLGMLQYANAYEKLIKTILNKN